MLALNSLNPQQREAVETLQGPVLILAGAGTGKTRVITYRIAHLMDRGVAPEHILGVTFTNKAAREMQQRIAALIGSPKRSKTKERAPRPVLTTFHSLGVRILRRHIDRLGYKPNFVIYDQSEQLGVVRKVLTRLHTNGKEADPAEVLAYISRAKNGITAGNRPPPAVPPLVEQVGRYYQSALRACNAVDFDDLIALTLKLFREQPPVLEACRDQFRFVMVDEYQDTNAAQFQLVQALAHQHRNLCVVGDDDQSIYGWRGAQTANLSDLEHYFPEIKVITLEQNYRSTTVILDAANALIRNNVRRRPKALWSTLGRGTRMTLHSFDTDEAEGRGIAEQIEFARVAYRIPWREQAVLFRTNQQSRALETALRQGGIRYRLIGGQSFFDRREIKDLLAFLKTLLNPQDDISLLRIANVPPRGLSPVTMERLLAASHERQTSVYATFRHTDVLARLPARARERLEHFASWIERTRSFLAQPAAAGSLQLWAERFLDEIGYWEDLLQSEKNRETADNRVRNAKDLLATIDEASGSEAGTLEQKLAGFLEHVTLDSDRSEAEEKGGDGVTLITIHSCKGLEFPHVYLVGLEDGLLPHAHSKEEGTLDEERRLCYVAMTRAMRSLTLSYCRSRRKFGKPVMCQPSPFLLELPSDLLESAEAKGNQPVTVETGKDLFGSLRAAIG